MPKVILSVHDASPLFRKEIEIIMEHFSNIPKSMLVTPLWDGWHRIDKGFSTMLNETDKVLHGLTHRSVGCDWAGKIFALSNRSDREFYNLTEAQTVQRIQLGKRLFEDAFDETPTGFIPPMWHHNLFSINTVRNLGFQFTENASHIIKLQEDTKQAAIPVCLDYGNNILLEKLMTFGWRYLVKHTMPEFVRLSIHPSDVTNGYLPHFDIMIKILKDKNYQFTTYQELMYGVPNAVEFIENFNLAWG